MEERLHVVISGRVQGVGFRYATAAQARCLGLSGWVRNLPTGQVEAEFCGPRAQVEAMLAWCGRGPALARVDDVAATRHTPDAAGAPTGFEILG